MKRGKAVVNGLVCLALLAATVCAAYGAITVKGTLLTPASTNTPIKIRTATGPYSFNADAATVVLRGQLGKPLRAVMLRELAPGDHIVAVVNQNGIAPSIKAFYSKTQGTLSKMQGDKLVFKEGKAVVLSDKAQVVLPNGKIGKPAHLTPGTFLICRINPVTNRAWTVVAASIAAKPVVTVSRTAPGKPVIRSVAYVADDPLEPGDTMTIQMSGTPGGHATCEIRDVISQTPMKEVFAGSYTVTITVPDGKIVHNSPLIGKLTVKGAAAEPVQAAKLVTVAMSKVAPMISTVGTPPPGMPAIPVEAAKPAAEPAVTPAPTPKPEPAPAVTTPPVVEPTRPPAPVALTQPADGMKIERAIIIRGSAEPESTVHVTVTYTNGLAGLLNLSGMVASQDLAVGKNGKFKMGPLPLEGPLATKGLRFMVKAWYPGVAGEAARVTVIGART